jgi:hypothetical protein
MQGRPKEDLVVVNGHLKTGSWEADGTMMSQLVLVCQSVHGMRLAPKAGVTKLLIANFPVENPEAMPF